MSFVGMIKNVKDELVDVIKDNLNSNKPEEINDSFDTNLDEYHYEKLGNNNVDNAEYIDPIDDDNADTGYYDEDNNNNVKNKYSYDRRDSLHPYLLTRQDIVMNTQHAEAARIKENQERGVYATHEDENLSLEEKREKQQRRAKQYKDFSNFSSADIPSMRYASPRFLNIITPVAYEDCERISASIRQGNITVLCFDSVGQDLYKRLLDFAFGAASIKGANVDCLRPGLFVFVEGAALIDSELQELRNKGLLE